MGEVGEALVEVQKEVERATTMVQEGATSAASVANSAG